MEQFPAQAKPRGNQQEKFRLSDTQRNADNVGFQALCKFSTKQNYWALCPKNITPNKNWKIERDTEGES